jgi:copper chaperone CopZ
MGMKLKSIFLAVILLLGTWLVSACGQQTTTKPIDWSAAEQTSFKVTELFCSSCLFKVKTAIERVKGVYEVRLEEEGTTAAVQVTFNKNETNPEKIEKSVTNLRNGVE